MAGEEESIEVPSEDAGPPRRKRGRTTSGARASAEEMEKIRHDVGWWESVPKVVCPHCELKGSVEKWKKGFEWHLYPLGEAGLYNPDPRGAALEYFTESAHLGQSSRGMSAFLLQGPNPQDRELIQGVVEAILSIGYPNMRCNNCTVEWRV